MEKQIKWIATLTDGQTTHVYTDPSATEDEARAKLAELMKSNWTNLILDISASRDPVTLELERRSAAIRDFAPMIKEIRPAT